MLFSVSETRVQDYEAFVQDGWRPLIVAGFEQGPTHPAVRVPWGDAQRFCAWLTARERKEGRITDAERYRLPSDHEWSCAAGLGGVEAAEALPEQKNRKTADLYPWGRGWPASGVLGNFSGEEATDALRVKTQFVLAGHRDGFPYTAPVGNFPASPTGLYDLAGNAMEWCEDWSEATQTKRTARGGSWFNSARDAYLSSTRFQEAPSVAPAFMGFRVVLAPAP